MIPSTLKANHKQTKTQKAKQQQKIINWTLGHRDWGISGTPSPPPGKECSWQMRMRQGRPLSSAHSSGYSKGGAVLGFHEASPGWGQGHWQAEKTGLTTWSQLTWAKGPRREGSKSDRGCALCLVAEDLKAGLWMAPSLCC